MEKIYKSEEEWRRLLTAEQYAVMRQQGTEKPFTCEFSQVKANGIYYCAACSLPLFISRTKFKSGTGWPSFYEPVDPKNIILKEDDSLLMQRTEVKCARCESHLGHVFGDGPPPTGLRYCINGIALVFKEDDEEYIHF